MISQIRNLILRRRQAYRQTFADNEATRIVLTDLRKFCRATSSPAMVSQNSGMIDPIATGIAIGRLEVWHRITQNVHISDADLYKLVDQSEGD